MRLALGIPVAIMVYSGMLLLYVGGDEIVDFSFCLFRKMGEVLQIYHPQVVVVESSDVRVQACVYLPLYSHVY